jgi:hypothetical protein
MILALMCRCTRAAGCLREGSAGMSPAVNVNQEYIMKKSLYVFAVLLAGVSGAWRAYGQEPAAAGEESYGTLAAASTPGYLAAAACFGDVSCPARFSQCYDWYDADCGDFFCRTPGAQCDAQPSTFIRVEHVSVCYDPEGNPCVAYRQGRRLDHCGCP